MAEQSGLGTESEQHLALRAAIQSGVDDIAHGRYEDVDDVTNWVQEIADTVTTKHVA